MHTINSEFPLFSVFILCSQLMKPNVADYRPMNAETLSFLCAIYLCSGQQFDQLWARKMIEVQRKIKILDNKL